MDKFKGFLTIIVLVLLGIFAAQNACQSAENNSSIPIISDINVLDISVPPFSSVKIIWETDIPTTSQVEYGTTPECGRYTPLNEHLTTHHLVELDNLEFNTIYFFRVRSRSSNGAEAISRNYTFATMPSDKVEVNFINSNYVHVIHKPTGWFKTGQNADILLGLNDFGMAKPTLFQRPMKVASDGQRLIVADTGNNRVLIWNSIPTQINQAPDIVIGQRDFFSSNPGIGADKLNWPVGVATDGHHLLVADTKNNRILIWNTFPTQNGQPADLVLGAPDFNTVGEIPSENNKKGFLWPWDVFTDGTHVIVTDTTFGRVLIWNTFPTQNYQPADVVLNQIGFGTPRCIAFDGQHLIIGDYTTNKAYVWNHLPQTDNEPFDFTLYSRGDVVPCDVSIVNNKLLVLYGNTVYIWNQFPTSENDQPDFILGKLDFGQAYIGPNSHPSRLTFDAGLGGIAATQDHLFISCYSENRILIYNHIPNSNNTLADVVLGAPDFNTNTLNKNYVIHCGSVCSDGSHLFVRDLNRIYIWKRLPNQSLAKPDIVYNISGSWAIAVHNNKLIASWNDKIAIWNEIPLNGEMPDIKLGPEFSNGMRLDLPRGIAADDNYMFVSDYLNNKIYVWEGGIPNSSEPPDFALDVPEPCQVSSDGNHLAVASLRYRIYIWNLPLNRDNLAPDLVLGSSDPNVQPRFNLPQGVFVDGEHLFVADTCFNRILIWNEIPTEPTQLPDIVLGQDDFESTYARTTRDGLFMPGHIWFDGAYLWVNEFKFSDRLVRFPVQPSGIIPPFISSIFAEPITGYSPLDVTFVCNAYDQDGTISLYKWDFNSDGQIDEITDNSTIIHRYDTPGTYNATCTVIDDQGSSTTSYPVSIQVEEIPGNCQNQECSDSLYCLCLSALKCDSTGSQCVNSDIFHPGDHFRLNLFINTPQDSGSDEVDLYFVTIFQDGTTIFLTSNPYEPVVIWEGGVIYPELAYLRNIQQIDAYLTLYEFDVPQGFVGSFEVFAVLNRVNQALDASSIMSNIAQLHIDFQQ